MLYPNPSESNITFQTKQDFTGGTYEILDILGKVIISGQVKSKLMVIDIQNIRNGVYFLNVRNGQQDMMVKFIRK